MRLLHRHYEGLNAIHAKSVRFAGGIWPSDFVVASEIILVGDRLIEPNNDLSAVGEFELALYERHRPSLHSLFIPND